jgi:hypothetical protein
MVSMGLLVWRGDTGVQAGGLVVADGTDEEQAAASRQHPPDAMGSEQGVIFRKRPTQGDGYRD